MGRGTQLSTLCALKSILNSGIGKGGFVKAQRIYSYIALALGRNEATNSGQRRDQRLVRSVLSSVLSKGLALVVNFSSVALAVPYLGAERYGIWVILSTILTWMQISDLGLGNGLVNALGASYGTERPDIARRYVATTFWMMMAFSLAVGVVALLIWWAVDWVALLNIQSQLARAEIGPAVLVTILLTLMLIPLSTTEKVLMGYQEGFQANVWLGLGYTASLVGLVIATSFQGGLVWLVAGFIGGQGLIKIASTIWLFRYHKPWLALNLAAVDVKSIKQLANVGGLFFIVQIAYLFIFQTDSLIIASTIGVEAVTPYSVTWRLFSYAAVLQSLAYPWLWSAFAEATARHDSRWIKRTLAWFLIANISSTVFLSLPLVLFGQQIIGLWAGPQSVPPTSLLIGMGVWNLLYVALSSLACFLNGSGRVAGQALYSSLTALVNIILSIVLAGFFGITGVIVATITAYLICSAIPQTIETIWVLRRLDRAH